MDRISLMAMVAAIVLTAGLVLVFGEAVPAERYASFDAPSARIHLATAEEKPNEKKDAAHRSGIDPLVTVHVITGTSGPVEVLQAAIDRMSATTTTIESSTTTTSPPPPPPTTAAAPAPPTTRARQASPTTRPTTTTTTTTAEFRAGDEADFLNRINQLRQAGGHTTLARNGQLDQLARDWSRTMANDDRLSHRNPVVPPGWTAAGENVGRAGSVSSLFNALVDSPGHHSNMVGNFTHVGIGVWRDNNGTLWTTHIFAR